MAEYQYRVNVNNCSTSNFGFAYFVLVNPSGSGRKLKLNSLEVFNHTSHSVTSSFFALTRNPYTDVDRGEEIKQLRNAADTTNTFPTTVHIYRGGATPTINPLIATYATRQTSTAGNHGRLLFGQQQNIGAREYQGYQRQLSSTVEPITINPYESVSLYHKEASGLCNPLRVNLILNVSGKTFVFDFVSTALPGTNLFSIVNDDDTVVVKLVSYSITDIGSSDTPTFRLVPVGQLYVDDVTNTSNRLQAYLSKFDTSNPNPPSNFEVYRDIGFIPYGVPEVAIADSSTGTPKNMNYLHTKDFLGPLYRIMLAERAGYRGAGLGLPDDLGLANSFKWSDWLVRRASIILNPGEGIAVVNSAETAVGVTAAYGGWPGFSFGLTITDVPANIPVIATSGVVVGSAWSIERVSNNSVVAQGTSADGTISYTYTTEDTPLDLRLKIRKASSAPYYKPYEVTFNLTYAGITLPTVQQELD